MQKIAILYDASQAVLSTFALDEVLNQILQIARDYFHLQNCAIYLFDPKTQMLKLRAYVGDESQSKTGSFPVEEGLCGAALKLKQPVYSADVARDARYIENVPGTCSELAIPLTVRDQVVGVLDCQIDRLDGFDKDTIDLLTLFSTQASIALQNAQLYSREQRRRTQMEAINSVARQTTSVLDLDHLLNDLCRVILQSFPVDQVALVLLEQGKLIVSRQRGRFAPKLSDGDTLPDAAGLCSRALSSGQPIVENDVRRVLGYIPGYDEARSEVCLPLISFGEPLGVLVLDSEKPDAFDADDVQAMQSVADICAIAVQNARHFQQARSLANLDGLTGIYNRRYFEQRILEEIERHRRYSGSLALILLDIDHFKKLNDEFGHLLGDEVLRQVSAMFRQHLRKIDVVCRYGGEEFAILVPETSGTNAFAVAEKLRKMVESWHFPGVPRPVTISAGVAAYPQDGRSRDELMKAADDALYAAKQQGRNRVLAATEKNTADRPATTVPQGF
jgi:diguanylate cyclase (GGDEF)-like protein